MPGNTCLSALRGEEMGELQRPLNNSKGCGGVMRVAPVGLVADDDEQAFNLGCGAAAITHGHPSGYYSAGCFAAIIYHWNCARRSRRWPATCSSSSRIRTPGAIVTLDRMVTT